MPQNYRARTFWRRPRRSWWSSCSLPGPEPWVWNPTDGFRDTNLLRRDHARARSRFWRLGSGEDFCSLWVVRWQSLSALKWRPWVRVSGMKRVSGEHMASTPNQVLKPLADYLITFRQQHRPSSQRLAISSVVTKLQIRTFLIHFNSSVNRIVDVKFTKATSFSSLRFHFHKPTNVSASISRGFILLNCFSKVTSK